MKFFYRRSNKINCFCNVCVSLLCTSYLFTSYYGHNINDDINYSQSAKIVENDMEVVSQSGKKGNKVTKVKTVVTKSKVNTSNKKYTPAKYNEVTGTAIVNYAKQYLGLRYVSGGNSLATGTDCSGFTKLIYQEFGVSLSRIVSSQVNNGSYVKKSDLQKGDLVFYGNGNGRVSHVAIYIGNGQVIHESNHRDGVKLSSVNMMQYITARRVINKTANEIAASKQENLVNKQNSDVTTNSNATSDENVVTTSPSQDNVNSENSSVDNQDSILNSGEVDNDSTTNSNNDVNSENDISGNKGSDSVETNPVDNNGTVEIDIPDSKVENSHYTDGEY